MFLVSIVTMIIIIKFLLHGYKINVHDSIFYCILLVSISVTYYNAIYTENAAKELHLTHMFLTGYDGCFEPSYASESAAAIITMVLQHTDNGCKLFLSVHLYRY